MTLLHLTLLHLTSPLVQGEGSEDGFDEMTEEQRIEREIDDENINVEVIVVGDELNYPVHGPYLYLHL